MCNLLIKEDDRDEEEEDDKDEEENDRDEGMYSLSWQLGSHWKFGCTFVICLWLSLTYAHLYLVLTYNRRR